MRIIVFTLFFAGLTSCTAAKTGSSSKKEDLQKLDSLILITSLPVYLFSSNLLFKSDIRLLLADSLKKRGFKLINEDENKSLFREFLSESSGMGNSEKMAEVAKKVMQDKDYFVKLSETAEPSSQQIQFRPCESMQSNCLAVKRYNSPNEKKQRSWEFKYEDTEPASHLVSRIIDTLTTYKIMK